MKEENEKAVLKLNIQKTKIMASGYITSWQIDGKTVETVTKFIFLCSKISVDGDCSHEIKMESQINSLETRIEIPEWSSGFPYFLQFQSEFGNKEFMI